MISAQSVASARQGVLPLAEVREFARSLRRIPQHIGVIPDGNRRWAEARGWGREAGYAFGVQPGRELFQLCEAVGVQELTIYGFTQDNTKRPAVQTRAFQEACIRSVESLMDQNAAIRVVGQTDSDLFPQELLRFAGEPVVCGTGAVRVNYLINYGWRWDVLGRGLEAGQHHTVCIPRMEMIIRWGGRRRLSGFLPLQSVYADFYVLDDLWPDFRPQHVLDALAWYQRQDPTLGG